MQGVHWGHGVVTSSMPMGESELPKIINEAGIAGLAYIGFRYWLCLSLFLEAILATRRSNNPLPFVLGSFAVTTLFVGQMTLQGTINGYGWLFAGFCMAANNFGRHQPPVLLPPKVRRRLRL